MTGNCKNIKILKPIKYLRSVINELFLTLYTLKISTQYAVFPKDLQNNFLFWRNVDKYGKMFFREATAGLGKCRMGSYGQIGVYRVSLTLLYSCIAIQLQTQPIHEPS